MLWKKSVNSVFQPPASQFFLSDVNSFQQKDLGVQICMKCWQFKKKKMLREMTQFVSFKISKVLIFLRSIRRGFITDQNKTSLRSIC